MKFDLKKDLSVEIYSQAVYTFRMGTSGMASRSKKSGVFEMYISAGFLFQ